MAQARPSTPPTAVSEPPSWNVTFTLPQGESGKPAWQQVDFYQFENTMTIVLHLDDYMTPYLSEGDQIAAIVNNEVREIADIQFYQQTENDPKKNMFMLLVPFADSETTADLSYYNAQTQKWSIPFYDLSSNTTKAHFRYYSAEKRAIYRAEVVIDVARIRRTVQTPYLLDF